MNQTNHDKSMRSGFAVKTSTLFNYLIRAILLWAAPVILVGFLLIANYVGLLHEEQNNEDYLRAHEISNRIDAEIASHIRGLEILAASPLLDAPARLGEFYKEMHAFLTVYGSHVILSDLSRQMLLNSRVPYGNRLPRLPSPIKPGGRVGLALAAETGKPVVGDIVFGPIAKEPLLTVIVPVKRQGEVVYGLINTFEASRLLKVVADMALPQRCSVTIMDSSGYGVLLSPSRKSDDPPGKEFVAKSDLTSWSVSLTTSNHSYFRGLTNVAVILLIVFVIAVLATLIGARRIARRISDSVKSLTEPEFKPSSETFFTEVEKVRSHLAESNSARDSLTSKLRLSEGKFRLFMDNSTALAWMKDENGQHIYANAKFEKQFGFGPEDWNYKTDYELWPEEVAEVFRKNDQAILDSGIPFEVIEETFNSQGEKTIWLSSKFPFSDLSGNRFVGGIATDVTDIKLAEQRLQASVDDLVEAKEELEHSRRMLRLFVDHSPVAMAMFDRDMRYLDVSPRWIKDYSLSNCDILGKSHYEIFPEIRDNWKEAHQKSLNGETVRSEGDRFERSDGSVQWLRWETRPWFKGDGNIGGIIIFTEDITERKNAEERLYCNELYLRSIIDSITEAVFLINLDGLILTANQTIGRTLGMEAANLVGKCIYDYLPPEVSERRKGWAKKVAKTGAPLETSDEHMGRELLHSIYPVFNSQGIVDQVAVYASDVTERVKMEKTIEEGERRYRTIVETANEGIWSIDQYFRITFVNEKMAQMMAYSVDEMIGMPLSSMIFDEDLADHELHMETRRLGDDETYERRLKKKDGSVLWTMLSATALLGEDGNFEGSFAMFTDITDRKKAQDSLTKSEQRLRMALEAAKAGTWEWDIRTNENYWSDELFQLYGLAPNSCIPSYDSWVIAIHPDDRPNAEKAVQEAVSKLHDINTEWRVNLPDGEERWLMSRGRPVFDGQNQVTSYLGVAIDITDRKRSEIEIRRSNQFLDTMLNNIPVMVAYLDRDGNHRYVNRSWQDTLGWSLEEAQNPEILALMYPDPDYRKFVIDFIASAHGMWGDFKTTKKDGQLIHTRWTNVPLGDDSNVGIGLDSTEQDEATHTRELLAAVVENSAESMVITDTYGNIEYVNPAFELATGYSSKEVLGQNPRLLKSGKQDTDFYRDLWATITEGKTWKGTLTNRRKDGSTFEEESTIFAIKDPGGKTTNFVGIQRDVTKELSLQRQLLQAQKLEALGTLAGGIAHDFNNILMSIGGYAELALDSVPENGGIRYDLEKILTATGRASQMVKQILAFSRKDEASRTNIDCRKIVEEGLRFLRGAIPATIELVFKAPPKIGMVHGDPTQVYQVLMNLCVNASHAMESDGGVLSVELSETNLGEDFTETHPPLVPGQYVNLSVSDTGTGIDPDILDKIFDPYFTTKQVGAGTGLGLSVVHGIIQSHGGGIFVTSQPGIGTRFDVFLPIVAVGSESPQERVSPLAPTGNETVLLVEDEPLVAELEQTILERLGYTVVVTNSPLEALELVKKNPMKFQVLITDFTMPKMTGISLAGQIRAVCPNMPIILCTGAKNEFATADKEHNPIDVVIEKPFGRQDIAVAIRQVLDKGN